GSTRVPAWPGVCGLLRCGRSARRNAPGPLRAPHPGPSMSGISSGVGIFSGINTDELINQLLQIEARPRALVQQRVVQLQAQQAAYLDINSKLSALKTAATAFNLRNIFGSARA